MLIVNDVEKYYGGNQILNSVSFRIAPREKVALIGVNGSGKTTLLRILLGQTHADKGSVTFTAANRISMLSQEVTILPENTLIEEMKRALPDITRMERRLRHLEDEMTRHSDNAELMETLIEEYSALQERFTHCNGHDVDWNIDLIIQGLGFQLSDKDRLVSEFSGGWQMRIELAKLLLGEVDLLLLDEPTNHLDLKAVEWLEGYLSNYPGAVLIVSHDRYFLNRVTTRTLHLERGRLRSYPGGYDFFIKKRKEERELQEKAFKEQQKKLEKDKRFIERFRAKNTLATRVKSREKMLEKMDLVEAPEDELKRIKMSIDADERGMTTVFSFKDLLKEYPGNDVPLEGDIDIGGGERVAILGANGCGKTTLLKIIGGIDREFLGKLKTHPAANIKYYMQNQAEHLNLENTVLEELYNSAPELTHTAARTLLGCFLFRAEDVYKQVSVLSGGEKSRLALAIMVSASSNVLLLDEPTNHLDFESREVLADALKDYNGTIVCVSHDRYFIEQLCDRVIEIQDGKLTSYGGNYSYYHWKKENSLKNQEPEETVVRISSKVTVQRRKSGARPSPRLKLRSDIEDVEKRIAELEDDMLLIEKDMEEPDNLADSEKMEELVAAYSKMKEGLDGAFEKWEELHEELEEVEQDLSVGTV